MQKDGEQIFVFIILVCFRLFRFVRLKIYLYRGKLNATTGQNFFETVVAENVPCVVFYIILQIDKMVFIAEVPRAMNIKIFKGFEDIYPEKVDGTDFWYYGRWTPCSEAYEVPDFKNKYPGTRLYLIEYPSGKIYEPIKQEENVFLESPVFECQDNSFAILRYDFNTEVIQVLIFKPEDSDVKVLTEMPFSKVGDMINVRLVTSPFALVKHNVHGDAVDFLWPKEMHLQFEANEGLCFQNNGKLYTSKWVEDPDYREEIIIRDAETGQIIERTPGYLRRMSDDSVWKMTP